MNKEKPPMPASIAINGFGRIGRAAFKVARGKDTCRIVAINDLTDPKTLAHLLRYDTVYGRYERTVGFDEHHLLVDGVRIPVLAEKDPTKLPWGTLGVDVVLECTGRFTENDAAQAHLKAGAKRVVVSAPTKGGTTQTFLLGVNDDRLRGEAVVSNASCTTNCIAPVAAIIHGHFGIRKALMTTIHSYTADQNLVDGPHQDLRRARAAAQNIVPTSTGAAISLTEIIPGLKGLFDGLAIRVPTAIVSLADFTFLIEKKTTAAAVNDLFRQAARSSRYRGIVAVSEEALVSSDFIMESASTIVDLPLTKVLDGDFLKVVAWYDNEWGYANRLVEMAIFVSKTVVRQANGKWRFPSRGRTQGRG